VLRRIFEPKRDEETGGWRKLHNEEKILLLKYVQVFCQTELCERDHA
jgi:hypothetical protein